MDLSYEALLGGERIQLSAEEAAAAWDECPEDLRRGRRDGAFILWGEDELGRRVFSIMFRPKRSSNV